MAFPETIFGKCPVCGGGGENNPDPGDAFSTEDHSGVGYRLYYYQGRLMCKMCKKRLSNNEQSKIAIAKYNENQRFLEKMGVKKNMED